MMWYEDPGAVVAVVILCIGLGYLTYRILKYIFDVF